MRLNKAKAAAAALCLSVLLSSHSRAADGAMPDVERIVVEATQPMMQHYGIPGMAVGIVTDRQSSVYNFGVTSKATGNPVTNDTLFEIGSLSKTFTATLAALAEGSGHLSLSDNASKFLPPLRGSSFDKVTLLNLGTHTPGGLPLQVPDEVKTDDQLMRYFRDWKPSSAPGTVRTYSNPSIGLLGMIAARSLNEDFDAATDRLVFQALGLRHTYLHVPEAEMPLYAQGYTKADVPTRMTPGMLDSEAYGIRTTAGECYALSAPTWAWCRSPPICSTPSWPRTPDTFSWEQ